MNKTFGDLMSEYTSVRESARLHSSWEKLDRFVEELVKQVAPKTAEKTTNKFKEYAYDDMGLALPHDET